MATGTVYLDVDDEITSAAARIRSSEATKVALVVPHGSRISTSRMNFRLLSREAVVNNRRLSIVAADPATRALAASAGLPVFASVAEYEASRAARPSDGDGTGVVGGTVAGAASAGLESSATVVVPPPDQRAEATTAPPAAPPPEESESEEALAPPPTRRRRRPAESLDATRPVRLPSEEGPSTPAAGAAAAGAAAGAGVASLPRTPAPATTVPPAQAPRPSRVVLSRGLLDGISIRGFDLTRGRTLPRVGGPTAIVAAAVVLAVVVLGVGAYVFLPTAEIVVTPRSEPIGPISLVVRADPEATAVDSDAAVVPAERVEVPVEVSETFTTAGRRVEETPATGEVTFSNLDFTTANTIPAGSVVSTQGGVRFRTNGAVTVDRARLVGLQIVPTEADVAITAVSPGTGGNVEPNTITVVPADEDPLTLKVRNRAATSGGTHEEFPRISQADLDAALEALTPKLEEAFAAAVGGGAGAPEGATPFPETAVLGEPTPTVDPATLLNQEVETFDLGLRATGTVIAVDDSPVERIAEQRLLQNVGADHRLVDGSVEIVAGDPTVENGEVRFPVRARAERVRLLDPADLLARIKGRTVDDAETTLSEFGEVEITTWPEWVTTITGVDSRLSLVIAGQSEEDLPGASAAPSEEPAASSPEPEPSPVPSQDSPQPSTSPSPAAT